MQIGIDIAQQRIPFAEVVSRARFAEDLGFTGVWGFDHFVPMYGEGPGECFEGMTTLAALATATTRVRLGLLVTGMTYRHPSVFTHMCNTIDHASDGRLDVSMGAAWFDAEHRALGIPFPSTGERFDLLEDAIEIYTRLCTGEVVSYDGRVVSLDDAQMRPSPVQTPRPPLWIGGQGPKRTLPLVGRFADVWHTWGPPAHIAPMWDQVRAHATAAGRDPDSVQRCGSISLSDASIDEIRAEAESFRDAGFAHVICGWPGEGRERIEAFARQVMPDLLAD